ncbi:MAG TPA: hypothetical protein VMF89_15535 [Polyangiales bacterium]|nr:hypothetical protein [Polyangiales bacterium]
MPARRFPVTSTIVPATKPAGEAGAAAPPSTAAPATAAAGSTASTGAAGTDAVAGAAGTPSTDPAVGGAAGAASTGPMGFDPATFDEAMGRSRGTAPLGTAVEPGGMECSNEVCKPLSELPPEAASMGVMINLCCTPEGECGTIGRGPMTTTEPTCRIIPDSDPQCARLELMGFEIASCCTADGRCGLNGQNFMQMPCGSIEDAMAMFGGFIELPPPAACVPGMGPPLSSSAPAPGGTTPSTGTETPAMPTAGAPATGAAGAAAPAAGAAAMPVAGSAP